MPSIPYVNNQKVKFHNSKKGILKRYVSAEIEVAGLQEAVYEKLKECISAWKGNIKGDGSLPSGGFEITTAPAKGDKFTKQIKEICAILKEGKVKVSKQCGLHVHVDARDLGPDDLIKVALLWQTVEEDMFKRVSKSRQTNHFCAKWGTNLTKDIKPKSKKPVKAVEFFKFMNETTYERYYSLNFAALRAHGTLENRMHQGTANPTKIINWAIINANIVEYAINNDYSHLYELKATPDAIWANTVKIEPVVMGAEPLPESARPLMTDDEVISYGHIVLDLLNPPAELERSFVVNE